MRIHILFLFSLLILCGYSLPAYGGVFPASEIPDDLKKDARAVVRRNYTQIDVQSANRAILRVEKAITILDKRGDAFSMAYVAYDEELGKVRVFEAEVQNDRGIVIKKVRKQDVHDESLTSGGSFITSSRIKYIDLEQNRYPYTVIYSYETVIAGLVRYPVWAPQMAEGVSVEDAKIEILMPANMSFTHWGENFEDNPVTGQEKGKKTYNWSLRNATPIKQQPYGPHVEELIPRLMITPDQVRMGNVSGQMDSWESFGEFYYKLNEGKDEVPPELAAKITPLLEGITDPYQKIEVLYKFMQQNTRYVSVQLGDGGWESFDAGYVYKNGYGDCKALSNYMRTMLKVADMKGYLTLVGAGEREAPVRTDFVNDPFNHVILCVPVEQDTVWLECTSSTKPIDYLGNWTEDRFVLVCTPQGGKLVRTPFSTPEQNIQFRKAQVVLDNEGHAKVSTVIQSSGFQQDAIREIDMTWSEKDKEKWIKKTIDAPSFTLTSYTLGELRDMAVPTYQVSYELEARNWAAVSGSRVFLTPNILEKRSSVPESVEERTQQIVTYHSYLDRDTIVYKIPNGYSIESMPEMPARVDTEFGFYQANIEMKDPNTLIYTRELKVEKSRLPAIYYEDFRNFFREVVKFDKLQIVLSGKS